MRSDAVPQVVWSHPATTGGNTYCGLVWRVTRTCPHVHLVFSGVAR